MKGRLNRRNLVIVATMLVLMAVVMIQVINRFVDAPVPLELEEEADIQEEPDTEPDKVEEVEIVPHESLLEGLSKESSFASGEGLGRLMIPKIDLGMTVIEHASAANLNRTLARMISSDMPGEEGNFVITGHRMYQYGSHFNRLDEMELGDEVFFEDESNRYRYEVESITFVAPSEIWITMGTNRDSVLTLITCTPIARATHRLVVFASLQEILPL